METRACKQRLIEAMGQFEIIDCHEHLGPEQRRLDVPVDVFTFFSHYTRGDLRVAGMPETEYDALYNRDIPLDVRWQSFAPYWEQIRWGSYARAALIAAEKFYGVDDINEQTYAPLSEAMGKANTPGLYERVLKKACNIRTALTQCGSTDLGGTPLLTPVMPMVYSTATWRELAHPEFEPDATIRSLDDYLDAVRRYVRRVKSEGAVGVKMISNPHGEPNREEAFSVWRQLESGTRAEATGVHPLRDYIVDETVSIATAEDMVVCVHTGYWGDFRKLDPLHMIPFLIRHPKARFDIYHLGYPWMREALMLGKGFPNVWLNLCWTHIISQRFAQAGLDEMIDLVPMNKILAFGGDYGMPVEKVYGHLLMAREDVAEVLARRVTGGRMTETQAVDLAHKWFWDNAKELYRLDV